MQTTHRIHFSPAQKMEAVADRSVALVVTSPPYPMIEMWDECFLRQDRKLTALLERGRGMAAFEAMHCRLDDVWKEVYRVLVPGGMACINIGDATRTLNNKFVLYPNHARILSAMTDLGFSPLPAILWRKQTNAPNKFMGSGMYPPGAYVTLEHEYVLVLRKGNKREFARPADKLNRRESAFFWEERNQWFSDVWTDLKGARQDLGERAERRRSGAFPFELPYRLISMFSVKGDTVLDPFAGTGTTMAAAMAAGRNSVGYEIESSLGPVAAAWTAIIVDAANQRMADRLNGHLAFVEARLKIKGPFKYANRHYGFPVVTRQEVDLLFNRLTTAETCADGAHRITYADTPPPDDCHSRTGWLAPDGAGPKRAAKGKQTPAPPGGAVQSSLFD